MSDTVKQAAEDTYPILSRKPAFVIPHGHYRDVYPDLVAKSEARRRLGIHEDAEVLLFFGNVRPYKNVSQLMRAFRELPDPDLRLVVAGRCIGFAAERVFSEISELAALDGRVHTALQFVPDAEVQVYFRAADVVVLPFREVWNSGSAILALSFGLPVVVPNRGSMAELAGLVGDEWVFTYDGELDPATLGNAVRWGGMPRATQPNLGRLEWSAIAEETVNCYRSLRLSP